MNCTRTSLFFGVILLAAALVAPAKTLDRRVSFKTQIKPILKNDCYDCHTGTNKKGGLDLTTKAGLVKGGDSGKLYKAGKSSQSLIVKRLKGLSGTRMPKGDDPLDTTQIRLIAKWIDEGAKIDQ